MIVACSGEVWSFRLSGFGRFAYEPLWALHLFFLFYLFYLLGFHPSYKGDYEQAMGISPRDG